jgi:diacylglycerol kinase (ATP)
MPPLNGDRKEQSPMHKPDQPTRLIKSFRHAFQGIFFTVKTQRNARIHLLAAVAVCIAGFAFNISAADWRWLISCIAFVWFAEMVNTAFEYLCDVVNPELHESVKNAKDIAAGAVLICAAAASVIGGLTFWPYIVVSLS